jgi:hypothetical protein
MYKKTLSIINVIIKYFRYIIFLIVDLIYYILLINVQLKATIKLVVAKWRFCLKMIRCTTNKEEAICVVSIILMSLNNHPLILNFIVIYPILLESIFTGFLHPDYIKYLIYFKVFITLQYSFIGLILEVSPLRVGKESYLQRKYPVGILVNFRKSLKFLKRIISLGN